MNTIVILAWGSVGQAESWTVRPDLKLTRTVRVRLNSGSPTKVTPTRVMQSSQAPHHPTTSQRSSDLFGVAAWGQVVLVVFSPYGREKEYHNNTTN